MNWLRLHFKAILYFFIALILFFGVAGWVFLTYYYEDLLNTYAVPKLEEAALTATNGYYRLKLGRISYHDHTVWCKQFDLQRVKYDSGARGIAVKRVLIDSLKFSGVSLFKFVLGRALAMTSLQMDSPQVFMTDLAQEKPTPKDLTADSIRIVNAPPKKLPLISFDSISLREIRLYLADRPNVTDRPSFKGIHFLLTNFIFNSETKESQPVLFSKRADIWIPDVKYSIGDGNYSLEFKNLHGDSEDSLITADHFGYVPNYSEEGFAARHKYAQSRLDFRTDGVRFEGVNFVSSFSKADLIFRKFYVSSWSFDSYKDYRRPEDPNPSAATMPNELVSALPVKIDVDSFILRNGRIKIREQDADEAGSLGFEQANLIISPISKDTMSKNYKKPAAIWMSASFLGAPLVATATYPLHEKNFNLDLHATMGSFAGTKLNSWLVPLNRLEISTGSLTSGKIDMSIRSGSATTSVLPIYDNFEISILAQKKGQSQSVMDKIKTFVAETFIVHDGNPGKSGLKTGVTTLAHTPDEEFMQFIWYAIRKSLGQVIGGFQ
jgi:hypothetical protein